jgi:hypothetical protein
MADKDRVEKLKERNSHLKEQLKKSEKLMTEFRKKIEAGAKTSTSKGEKVPGRPAGKVKQKLDEDELAKANRELKRQLEVQRRELEALAGRHNRDIKAAQDERDELVRRLRLAQKALAEKGESFEDEPTVSYTQEMENVIEKEKGTIAQAAQFTEEEATESYFVDEILAQKAKDEEEDS